MDTTAAAIAFFALGANFLGAVLLLLFNPRNREVHWYFAFLVTMCTWLLAQGMDALDVGFSAWDLVLPAAVTMLPALFLASAIVERKPESRMHWLVVFAGLAMVPLMLPAFNGDGAPALRILWPLWNAFGWFSGSMLLFRRPPSQSSRKRTEYVIVISLLIIVPVLVTLGMLLGSHRFFLYVLPLLTVAVQFIIFIGVVRLRFYDIEVRAARTGELAAQTAAAERLTLLGEVSASIAHEVRNPLTGMRSLAQTLAEEADVDADRRKRYARVVLDEIGRLERMVNNLLGVARRSGPAYGTGPTELAPLFDDLGLLVQAQARRRDLTLDVRAQDLAVAAPREALAQALLNLLLNAITHSPEGGRVSLWAHDRGDVVQLTVRDAGRGIAPAERERIFQPFTSDTDGGVGLGLSVVRRIADELGWTLEVDDAPGGGAELRVTVPGVQASALAEARA